MRHGRFSMININYNNENRIFPKYDPRIIQPRESDDDLTGLINGRGMLGLGFAPKLLTSKPKVFRN
jgi:hypothetical protein